MAQEVMDRVVGPDGPKCTTLDISLFGGEGCTYHSDDCVCVCVKIPATHCCLLHLFLLDSEHLPVDLIQKHGMSHESARHLAKTYGGRSWEVCQLSQPTNKVWPRFGVPLVEGYPYIDAEVAWACREYACTIEDVLSRRTRLAFLNRDAALAAIPRVANCMAKELGWSKEVKAKQMMAARVYVESYVGRIPDKHGAKLREATYRDVQDIFNAIDTDGNGYLDHQEIGEVAEVLGFPMSEKELAVAFQELDADSNGRISFEEFEQWWNHSNAETQLRKNLAQQLGLGGLEKEDLKKMGPGTFLG
jgi:glycerol-3-phosphate dehydrogenase